jgi:hypothetical protein
MKNVTISMDEETLAGVRIEAAKAGLSVSRWIARSLEQAIGDRKVKAAASARIEQLLADTAKLPLSEGGRISIDRDELYGDRFRRYDHPALSSGPGRADQGAGLRGVAEGAAGRRPSGDEPAGSE